MRSVELYGMTQAFRFLEITNSIKMFNSKHMSMYVHIFYDPMFCSVISPLCWEGYRKHYRISSCIY